jgi:hypothetical protein
MSSRVRETPGAKGEIASSSRSIARISPSVATAQFRHQDRQAPGLLSVSSIM